MQKIKKMQMQINKLFSLLQEDKYKNKIPLERKIEKLYNDLKIEKERYNKEMESKYWQNESTY
jgi:LytS/YehU family sensor histidine kinase